MDLLGSGMRLLAEKEEEPPPERWELILMSFIMIFMFAALITDRVAPDHVFVIAVAFCMVTGIITISEGLKGFANEGVLTVMVRKHVSYCVPLRTHCLRRGVVVVVVVVGAVVPSLPPCPHARLLADLVRFRRQ
jgi:hypothetical protein